MYHNFYRSLIIFIMTCFHGILKKSIKIVLISEHTHTTLSKE